MLKKCFVRSAALLEHISAVLAILGSGARGSLARFDMGCIVENGAWYAFA
jgi:hypothetical protein